MTDDERRRARVLHVYEITGARRDAARRERFVERMSVALIALFTAAALAAWYFAGPLP